MWLGAAGFFTCCRRNSARSHLPAWPVQEVWPHNVINLQEENNNDNVGARPRSQKNMLALRAAWLYEGKGMDFDPDNDRINDCIIDHIKTCFLGLFTTTKTMLLALLRELGRLCYTALGITLSMDTGVNIARTHKVKKLCGGKLRKFLNSLL